MNLQQQIEAALNYPGNEYYVFKKDQLRTLLETAFKEKAFDEDKLEQEADKRLLKRLHDIRFTDADIFQTYRTGFEDGYDFRREQILTSPDPETGLE